MRISNSGIDLIKEFEQFSLHAYLDAVSVPTIGYGSTRYEDGTKVKMGDVITSERAKKMLLHDVTGFENDINSSVKVPLTQNQFDALVSFQYNTGGIKGSTLLARLNAGDYAGAADQLLRWNKGTKNGVKVVLPGLTARRQKERQLFLKTV